MARVRMAQLLYWDVK